MTEPNNILHFLRKSTDFLEKKGLTSPRVDAEWILADLLDLSRIKLYSQFEMPLNLDEVEIYRARIVERGKRKPVAYIIGKKGFHNFDFKVSPHVLIPRPETEELVDWFYKNIYHYLSKENENRLLDLGTGSGCIAVSLARLIPELNIWASDLSEGALEIAKENEKLIPKSESHVKEITFIISDLFSNFPSDLTFDVIFSNPSYIPILEKKDIMDDVLLYEPHLALFVEDFEEFHARLVSGAFARLNFGGILLLETHPDYIAWLAEKAKELGFNEIKIMKDGSNKERFLLAKKSHLDTGLRPTR